MAKIQFLIEIDVSDNADPEWIGKLIKSQIENHFRPVKVTRLGYQRIFNAIGDAAKLAWGGTAISISVASFLESIQK